LKKRAFYPATAVSPITRLKVRIKLHRAAAAKDYRAAWISFTVAAFQSL